MESLPSFQTNQPDPSEPVVSAREIRWFKVYAAIPDRTDIVTARTWNGSNSGNTDYTIAIASPKAVDTPFYATRPEGGTGKKYGTPLKPVDWVEITGGISVGFCKALADWKPATVGGVMPHTFEVNPCDSAGVVPAGAATFKVRTHGSITGGPNLYLPVAEGDVITYIPVAGLPEDAIGIVLPLPIAGGGIAAVMQNTGLHVVGFDYLRSHTDYPTPTPP